MSKTWQIPLFLRRLRVQPYFSLLTNGQAFLCWLTSTMAVALLTFFNSLFELHLYAIVKNDVTYHGKWGMSYEFVYSGTPAVREALILFCILSATAASALFVASACVFKRGSIPSSRKAGLSQTLIYLVSSLGFLLFRTTAFVFSSVVNDPQYSYWTVTGLLNAALIICQVYNTLISWAHYLELACGPQPRSSTRSEGSLLQTQRQNGFRSAYHENGASCEILAAEELVVLAELQRPIRSPGFDYTSELSESPLLFQISCDPKVKMHTV